MEQRVEEKFLVVKNQKRVTRVDAFEIMYVLKDGRRLIVVTESEEYVYYDKMSSVMRMEAEGFYMPLQRCIVNLNHLKSVEVPRKRLIFRNGEELFLGRDACCQVKKVFNRYLLDKIIDVETDFAAEDDAEYRKEKEKKRTCHRGT